MSLNSQKGNAGENIKKDIFARSKVDCFGGRGGATCCPGVQAAPGGIETPGMNGDVHHPSNEGGRKSGLLVTEIP